VRRGGGEGQQHGHYVIEGRGELWTCPPQHELPLPTRGEPAAQGRVNHPKGMTLAAKAATKVGQYVLVVGTLGFAWECK